MSQISVYNLKSVICIKYNLKYVSKYNCAELELTKNTIESKNAKKNPILRNNNYEQLFLDCEVCLQIPKGACPQTSCNRLSYKEHMVDALALGAEEGRDKLRKATGRCT